VSTSLLVSTSAVSFYPAAMVNFWSTNEKCLSCQHWTTCGHEIRHFSIQKCNHFANSVCWCTVLLEHVKVQLSPQTCKCDRFARFFVAVTVKLQKFVINEPDFSPSKQGGNWQHELRLASLCPWHIMMSALHHA